MVQNKMLYEAFVLACLWRKQTENKYCAKFMDTWGPYSRQACKERAIEIADNLYKHDPEYQARTHRCEEFKSIEEYEHRGLLYR